MAQKERNARLVSTTTETDPSAPAASGAATTRTFFVHCLGRIVRSAAAAHVTGVSLGAEACLEGPSGFGPALYAARCDLTIPRLPRPAAQRGGDRGRDGGHERRHLRLHRPGRTLPGAEAVRRSRQPDGDAAGDQRDAARLAGD